MTYFERHIELDSLRNLISRRRLRTCDLVILLEKMSSGSSHEVHNLLSGMIDSDMCVI